MKRRWLVLQPATAEETTVNLEKAFYQIGRGAEALIRIPNSRVSALHASLLVKGDGVTLIDLDSTNGTRVNGKKIKQTLLNDKDEIQLAEVRMIFREEADAPSDSDAGFKTETGLTVQLEKNIPRLDALYNMLETNLGFTERDSLIEAMLLEITRILDLEVCGLYLREEEAFFIIENNRLKRESKTETISETLLDKVMNGGAPVFLEDIGNDSGVVGFKSLMDFRIQSLLCLPVMDFRKNVIGALYCVSRKSGQLGILEKDRLFLKASSSIISMSLSSINNLIREKAFAQGEEKRKQEERFIPLIRKLKDKSDALSLRYENAQENTLFGMEDSVGRSLADFISKAARADLPVLLSGETGVGKTLLAREIHKQGRGALPFVTVDCTTLPADLLESELFGHEKGAFTGAVNRKIGRVALAKNGTLFVDEIGDLPLLLQGKLLRLIQTGEFEAVGGVAVQRCTARLIFATNKDLKVEVREKRFREDLYFRLNVLQTVVPPLRTRKNLILPLAEHFLKLYRDRTNGTVKGFSSKAKEALLSHVWPGNIRELENAVSRSLINADGEFIDTEHLELAEYSIAMPADGDNGFQPSAMMEEGSFDLKLARERVDRVFIRKVLALTGGNVSQAAKKLNISRNSLMELISKYGI